MNIRKEIYLGMDWNIIRFEPVVYIKCHWYGLQNYFLFIEIKGHHLFTIENCDYVFRIFIFGILVRYKWKV